MSGLRLVLGTADLVDDEITPRLLDQFVASGGRALDVANVYASGSSQRAVGRWLRKQSSDLLIFAKGCHPPLCAPSLVRAEVDEARRSLGVDRLDAFLLHRDDPAVPIEAWATALDSALDRGTVEIVGVSNWTEERFANLKELLGEHAAVFSNHFSLAKMQEPPWPDSRSMDPAAAARLVATGVTVLAWASLAGGYLAGTHGSSAASWESSANAERRVRVHELARALATSAAAVALAYVMAHSGVRPVVGTRSPEHLAEALRADDLALSPEQVAYLELGS